MSPRGGRSQERLTLQQRHVLDDWVVWLYGQGYTTAQAGSALGLSASSISNSLVRRGVPHRGSLGRRADLEPGVYARPWRALEPVPGTALAAGALNRHGLLTSALATWKSKNALAVFASRVQDAAEEERKEAVAVLEETVAYARQLQKVLSDPGFAAEVRKDPAYRDDVGHRFR